MVQKDKEQTDIGKVKDDTPIGELALFVDLVIEDEDHHGCDKRQNNSTQDNEYILRNE